MSTIAYALFTTAREKAQPGTSKNRSSPGVSTYVDTLASLVPSEVLILHGVILSVTTKTDNATIQIIAPGTLFWAFIGLMVLSVALYLIPRLRTGKWDRLDYVRAAIPPLAFVGWTMLQRATAFDAVYASLAEAPRTVIALFLGVSLGILAANLAFKADQKQP
jgi:hypothetical protein